MVLDGGFVVAVLKGIEGTLSEVIERVEISELRASLAVLHSRASSLSWTTMTRWSNKCARI